MSLRIVIFALLILAPAAHAQLNIDWYTIDGGGGASSGAGLSITGTIGQYDTANSSAPGLECAGGLWSGLTGQPSCYANCDGSTAPPILNANDFICFIARFSEQDAYANCDQSTVEPVLNANDFICFINAHFVGCS